MINLITYEELQQYGKMTNSILYVKKGFEIERESKSEMQCILVRTLSCYTGNEAPRIYFELTVQGQDKSIYKSPIYNIGQKDEYTCQSWRVPPMFLPGMKMTMTVDVPDGTVLKICNMSAEHSSYVKDWNEGGLRHNAHLGFWGIAPDNTMPAFELAAICGFPACIVVPKVTADGILVCIHDDTINRTARDEFGNAPKEDKYVWNMTYEELLKWEYGSYKNEIYKGTKIPRLEDFFALCSRTGMRPMFSTHPGLTVEQWGQVKDMLIRHGLLKNFHIKSFELDILKTAYTVFGTSIDGYTWDNDRWEEGKAEETLDINALLEVGIDSTKCRVGIEIPLRDYTESIARKIIDAGLFAAAFDVKNPTTEDYKRLISYGVTEFTEDYHCSMGLNW